MAIIMLIQKNKINEYGDLISLEIIPLRPIQNQKRTHIDANKRIIFVDAILKKLIQKKEINIKFKNGANHKLIY